MAKTKPVSSLPDDGPQFVVGLQDKTETNRYKDKKEFVKKESAMTEAKSLAVKEKTPTIIYDRKAGRVVERFDATGLNVTK